MGFDFGMDEMCRHRPFQNCIALYYTTPKFFFIALQSWSSRHVIQFLYLVSKHSPRQCSDRSVIKKVRWDSILAWIKCSATALLKTVLHCFIQPLQIFFIALQSWSSRHVIQFLNLVSKHSTIALFYTTPKYFFLHFKVGQVDILY